MKQRAKVAKLGLMVAILASIAICSSIMVTSAQAEDVDRIPFLLPTLKADKMPPVFFSHDKHIEAVEGMDGDCSSCHTSSDEFFLDSEEKSADEVMAYVHDNCVSCHAGVPAGQPTGPVLASCRSCHSETIAAAQAAAE